ncbi:MAG: hypothetical protein JXA10_06415 [Anaerolineae bacterium]|nr:hypothetical protein [Anaerolineae bacterium]
MEIQTNVDIQELYRHIEIVAEMAEVPVDQEQVKRILNVYQAQFEQGAVSFRTTTKPVGKRELSVRYIDVENDHDPYAMALDNGLLTEEGHPIERLLADAREQYPMMCYGVDVGASHGIEKIWPLFDAALPVEDLFKLPSMPESVRAYTDHFAKFDLELFTLFAIDYHNKSMNVYFPIKYPGQYPPERCAEMISDLGFQVPDDEELAVNAHTGIIYYTFTWESPQCERFSFGVPHVPVPSEQFPMHWHPVFERLCNEMPVLAPERKASVQTAYLPDSSKDYRKIEIDYTGTMMMALGATIMLIP